MASKVCVLPALSVTVNVTVLPGAKSVLPDMLGVSSLPVPCGFSVSTGAVVSILPPSSVTVVELPASSVAVTSTL